MALGNCIFFPPLRRRLAWGFLELPFPPARATDAPKPEEATEAEGFLARPVDRQEEATLVSCRSWDILLPPPPLLGTEEEDEALRTSCCIRALFPRDPLRMASLRSVLAELLTAVFEEPPGVFTAGPLLEPLLAALLAELSSQLLFPLTRPTARFRTTLPTLARSFSRFSRIPLILSPWDFLMISARLRRDAWSDLQSGEAWRSLMSVRCCDAENLFSLPQVAMGARSLSSGLRFLAGGGEEASTPSSHAMSFQSWSIRCRNW
mmetsp:Transcript_58729/g.124701  ORF Transcript_58729/g.124701 Transcript_58729/m.124701 type:complete len:263 (-) Transcript_58729:971-1759(-)